MSPFAAAMRPLLEEALGAGQHLLTILDDERRALGAGDNDAMERTGADKQASLTRLEDLERRRANICREHGKAVEAKHMGDHTREADPTGQLADEWETLRSIMRQCQDANNINGHVLRLRRQHVARALAVLRGEDPGERLYGPHGEDATKGETPLLGEA